MSSLRLRFDPEDEWHGQLFATVSSKGFEGRASAWFATDDLRHFSKAMSAYPLVAENLPSVSGGFGLEPGTAEPAQVHLAIDVAPHDVRGTLRFTVRLATEMRGTRNGDPGCSATIRFVATYGDLGPFASDVSALVEGRIEEAILHTNAGQE